MKKKYIPAMYIQALELQTKCTVILYDENGKAYGKILPAPKKN